MNEYEEDLYAIDYCKKYDQDGQASVMYIFTRYKCSFYYSDANKVQW